MGREEIIPRRAAQTRRAQGGDDRDKPIDDHRHPVLRAAQKDAAHGAQVKAANLLQHIHRVRRVGPVLFQRLGDDLLFPAEALVVHTAAAPGDIRHCRARQRAQNGGRCCRIANAHLADADGCDMVRRRLVRQLDAHQDRLQRLLARHRRL